MRLVYLAGTYNSAGFWPDTGLIRQVTSCLLQKESTEDFTTLLFLCDYLGPAFCGLGLLGRSFGFPPLVLCVPGPSDSLLQSYGNPSFSSPMVHRNNRIILCSVSSFRST